jgi:hypothetical protein
LKSPGVTVPSSPDSIDELRENRGQHLNIEMAVVEKENARAPLPSWQLCTVRGQGGVRNGICRGCEEINSERRRERPQ